MTAVYSIAENTADVKERIARAAEKAGRSAGEILLIAATKTQPASAVKEAISAGADASGENRAGELAEKKTLGAYNGAPVHFIGHLQKNKAKSVVFEADMIQSVDSVELLELISRIAEAGGIRRDILLEVNIAKETGKFGFDPAELPRVLETCGRYCGVKIKGLMAIPPIALRPGDNERYFSDMQKLYVDNGAKKYDNVHMDFLSMGMSGDFESAVLFGSNMVRIGSAIFGPRL
ncbi:MAG: YggS family pyridoxal phosphate-dependent enzyme [Oscillospiraceae bacterium]|nr:YggS family pyridoxal phosphate-dependent enzyme [Oscillospiraceae bacterium]